jgi:hypothetical protein
MLAFVLRLAVRMLVLAAVLYATFFVPIGTRTLYAHITRIAATDEAHELIEAVSIKAKEAAHAVAARVSSNPQRRD